MNKHLEELSKEVSYALRHNPQEYGLILDNNGWGDLNILLSSLQKKSKWQNLCLEDFILMIKMSKKKRHEIKDNKIRAYYGHSQTTDIEYKSKTPPQYLYHGTANRFLTSIKETGLKPMERQYVHLSEDIETAAQVGKRWDSNPVILKINAKEAYTDGLCFYSTNNHIWLIKDLPARYINFTN